MPTSTPPFRFRSPVCRRFFAAYHGSMPRPSRRTAGTRRGKSAQLGIRRNCLLPGGNGTKKLGRKAARRPICRRKAKAATQSATRRSSTTALADTHPAKGNTKPTAQTPSTAALFSYDAENDLRASRTVRYWRWLMGTASLQSMTSPSAEAWTTCSIFAK